MRWIAQTETDTQPEAAPGGIDWSRVGDEAGRFWELVTGDPVLTAMLITLAAVIVIFLIYRAFSRRKRRQEDTQPVEPAATASPHLEQLVERWDATTDWPTRLQATDRRPWFSIEVEDALINDSTQPLLILGMIEDIRRDEGGYICEVRALARVRADLRFEIKAPAEQIEPVLATPAARVGRFAIVATVKQVTRQRFAALVSGDEVTLGTTHHFVATAEAHELLRLDV